jgi:hypothetical protein
VGHLFEKAPTFIFWPKAIVAPPEDAPNEADVLSSRLSQLFPMELYGVSQPQRIEISFFGTHIRAEGIAGIIGAIAIVGVILAIYIGS